jgi:hypothetical protein
MDPFVGLSSVVDPLFERPFGIMSRRMASVDPLFGDDPFGMTDRMTPLLQSQQSQMKQFSPILKADLVETEGGFEVHCDRKSPKYRVIIFLVLL